MKKAILRVLLLICGLNVFTACYGMPPGEWPEPTSAPEEQEQEQTKVSEQTKASEQPAEVPNQEDPDEIDTPNADNSSSCPGIF